MATYPNNPFSPEDYQVRQVHSLRDFLVLGVDSALLRMRQTFEDITEEEYLWEPLPEAERLADMALPPEEKRVWRVFEKDGRFTYDYGLVTSTPSPFTTIAWIMNHVAQTADMYLYCILSGKPAGEERTWDDVPVQRNLADMRKYGYRTMEDTRRYLLSLDAGEQDAELNKFTPAPWGEMRPTYLNLWGGIIEHAIQHAMQIAVRKERIRARY